MPPVRTPKKNSSAAESSSLIAYGFDKERDTTVTNKTFDSEAVAGPPESDYTIPDKTVTDETVDSKAIASPTTAVPKRESPVPLSKGVRYAKFGDDRYDWDEKYHQKIGTSTRAITFESDFALSNTHIEQILAMGARVCGTLTNLTFNYENVNYDARNSAKALTDEPMVRLAEACPKLKKVKLQDATGLGDETLLAFLRCCSDLTSLEITGNHSWPRFSGAPLEALEHEPDWVPGLKMLILPSNDDRKFMKAMRAVTKVRIGLTVRLVHVSEVKKWGDWELERFHETYKKGRLQSIR